MEYIFYLFIMFVLGGSLGSFFKLTVDRYNMGISIIHRPSYCFSCENNIKWHENVPVLSYIVLHGKCSNCQSPIDFNIFLSELFSGFVSVLFFMFIYENEMSFSLKVCSYIFISLLLWLSMFDLKHRIVPHNITYPAILFFLIYSFFIFDSHLTPFENLGISFFFLDALVALMQIFRKRSLEQSNVLFPLLFWLVAFFLTQNIVFAVLFGLINIFFLCKGFEIKNKQLNIFIWLFVIALFSFHFIKLIFIDFNFVQLSFLLSGIGFIYFLCDVLIYFLHLFFFTKIEESTNNLEQNFDINSVAMGGGDITVFALISVFLGYQKAFFSMFLASILALVVTLISKIFLKDKLVSQFIPFVPYIALACFIIILAFKF